MPNKVEGKRKQLGPRASRKVKKIVGGGYVAKASLNNFRVSPRKARLVVDLIRGLGVDSALDVLANCDKKTAPIVKKLLLSAVANAEKTGVDLDLLVVKRIWVSEGRTLHRMMPRAQGRATPIRKRFSSINMHLDEAR